MTTPSVTEAPHLILRPSAADSWLRCESQPGAVRDAILAGDIPVEEAFSPYADEGVKVHEWASRVLLKAAGRPSSPAGVFPGDASEVPLLEALYINPIIDILLHHAPERFGIETEVTLWYNSRKGFIDFWWYNEKTKTLHVWDLKWGRGVRVSPESYQCRIYAVALMLWILPPNIRDEVETLNVLIVQPRQDLPVRPRRYTRKEVDDFHTMVDQSASRILRGMPHPLTPGDKQCQWCRVRHLCPAVMGAAQAAAKQVFAEAVVPLPLKPKGGVAEAPRRPADDVLREAAQIIGVVELWVDAVYDALEARIFHDPDFVPELKLVHGRKGNREWSDEEKVIEVLDDARIPQKDYTTPKLLTVAALQKLVNARRPKLWDKLKALVQQSEGKLKIVPVDDPREQVRRATAKEVFDPFANDSDPFAS